MQLTFNEAVDYLKGMFPAWDRDALSQILSANEGRMARTIDEILNLDSKNAGVHEPKRLTRIQSMRAKRPSINMPRKEESPTKPLIRKANPDYKSRVENNVVYRGSKFVLPPSFLNLPQDPSNLAKKKKRRIVISDAKLAHLLRNELFRQRLEAYGYSFRPTEGSDFTLRLEPEPIPEESTHSTTSAPPSPAPRASPRGSIRVDSEDGNLGKAISSLGESTKRNLGMLAFRFVHGVDEMVPLEDGKHAEFDFDDVYDHDETADLNETSKHFDESARGMRSPKAP